ncbi:hypothetical protein Q5H93_12390 [Hymenobacter sp. ASUV-10]|uniref:Uncharacterized protein n=1 Tax=Hymenobacter aranciens TaxID=3063996 RepID=A0ABT9BB83_9BACT|nr:hypothetical protein [Hymenobacter sp. ASUV-10]MDO7875534.1 hypothetical protein [Hymenobacter sp. ASUV-10]
MAKKTLPQLPADVAAKYRATIVPTVVILPTLQRRIDMTKLTVAEADELVKLKEFPYLVLKRQRKKAA